MATFIEQKRKEKKLIYLLFILLFLGGILILYFFFFSENNFLINNFPKESLEFQFKPIEIDLKIFDNPLLKELSQFEKISSFEGNIGRENPFTPF